MNKNYIYDGFHKIEMIKAEMKGKTVSRERLIIPSAVGGLVVDSKGRVALVSQYRPTIGQYTKEIPAGILDKNLSKIDTLLEELEEECEIKRTDIVHIYHKPFKEYYMITGSSDAKITLYAILVNDQGLDHKEILDDNDVESIEWVTFDQFTKYVDDGLIVDAKTLFAYDYMLYVFKDRL